jgi:bifunctional non-homologous end joining protein LigD
VSADDRLAAYRRKRDFSRTPEPAGGEPVPPSDRPRFVVHEHHASSLHWDLRLEHDGVLASWAVPKGIPLEPGTRRLAVRTEDHPLEYLTFEGSIPEGQYGAGEIRIWDSGTYDPLKFLPSEVMVDLHGGRLRGRYVLVPTGGNRWLLQRIDSTDGPGREPLPRDLRPMLAVPGPLPDDPEGWAFEVKWDGIRALAFAEGGRVHFRSRRGNDISSQFPELRALAQRYPDTSMVLDGEIVAFDERGVPSFERLQSRLGVAERRARALAEAVPAVFVIFDLLFFDGRRTLTLPYDERRRLLESLELEGPHWQTPRAFTGDPETIFAAAVERGLEGIVCKRTDSPYEPGRRSPSWRKVKARSAQEFVIVGWTPRKGAGFGDIGALLLAYYDPPSSAPERRRLVYAGRAGTGLSEAEAVRLARSLAPLASEEPTVEAPDAPPDARWVRPELVARVEFTGWTESGRLRNPVFLGLRPDADPREVVRETSEPSA